MIEQKKASVEGSQQWIAQGKKWQRLIEVAGTLAELDNQIKECLAKTNRERDQLEGIDLRAILGKREVAIKTIKFIERVQTQGEAGS
jgi:hypothetical protein